MPYAADDVLDAPPAPKGEPVAVDRRHDADVRKRMSGPAIRTFFNIADRWDLSVAEQRAVLGWPATSTYHKYKAGEVGTLSYDTLTRISLVMGLYKAINILYPDSSLADRWIKLPNNNPMFGGRSALEFITSGDIDRLYAVRRLLDARRGVNRSGHPFHHLAHHPLLLPAVLTRGSGLFPAFCEHRSRAV